MCYADDIGDRALVDGVLPLKDVRPGHSRESSLATDPSGMVEYDGTKISLKGDGLRHAKTKEEAEFVIDGSEAGPGTF